MSLQILQPQNNRIMIQVCKNAGKHEEPDIP